MPASAYAEQFPWDKVDAAKRYLYLVKPWWARFGERLTIVPVYQPAPEGKPYGSITSTDGGFRLYIDTAFASWAPLHLLAGAIEHEFQHHTRDSWNRLTWLSLDEWREWANIAFDLEINSGIEHESTRISMDKVRALAEKSHVFVDYELDFWGVTEPPNIGEDGWLPRLIGLPDRLSAEEYLRILQMAKQDPPPPPPAPDDSGDAEGSVNGGEGSSNSDEERDSGGNAAGEQQSDHGDGDSPTGGGNDSQEEGNPGEESGEPQDEPSGEGATPDTDDGSEGSNADGNDEQDGDEDGSGTGQSPDDGANDAHGDGDGTGCDDKPSDDSPESNPGDSPSEGGQPQSGDGGVPTSGQPQEGGKPGPPEKSLAQTLAEMKATGDRRMWSAEIANPKDELIRPAWKPDDRHNEKALDRASIEGAMIELEEDVREYAKEGPDVFGLHPGANLLRWVAKRRRTRGVDWQSKLNRLLSSNFNSAKTHGASDLSYAVRNPNQPEFGVILQGLHDYAPTITVIQDVSGSMIANDGMNKAMSAFTDLCSKVLGRFNTPVTWVTVDAGIIDVGTASAWTKHQAKRWSYGFGGTDIAPAIEQVMTGKLVWEGKKYPKADLTVISTDCIFEWPKRRPIRNGRLLVVSVEPDMKKLDKFIPDWVDRRRELVVIDD